MKVIAASAQPQTKAVEHYMRVRGDDTVNISVVIPAWNAEPTLAETLDSLLAQTHVAWEAIIVDDGSSDGTGCVGQEYAKHDPRIHVIRQTNKGEAGARNAGIAAARHDWLLFLDADDWIAPGHLERLSAQLALDASLDAVHCGWARVAADGTRIIDPFIPPAGDMFSTWARRSAFPVHACIVRRSLVEQIGAFDTSLQKSADWDMWQRIARMGARFGAVREVLAFYRMRPGAASLEAPQMLRDGLRVIRRGHGPDARVPKPHPDHAAGASPDDVRNQAWYLLSWCAGLLIGQDEDARPLIELCDVQPFPELYAPAVAQCIFDAATLPHCQPTSAWVQLWARVHSRADTFLTALEQAAGAPELARHAHAALVRLVLRSSPAFSAVADELETEKTLRAELESALDQAQRAHESLEDRVAQLEAETTELMASRRRVDAERETIWRSPERQLGDLLLNRFRLRYPVTAAIRLTTSVAQRAVNARLRAERAVANPGQRRLVTTVCWNFPIHSQTFVYEELTQLMRSDFSLRLIYSRQEPRHHLHERFAQLWKLRRRLFQNRGLHQHNFAHYQRRFDTRVKTLISKICDASGLSRAELVSHTNFLEAFTFTRMVEAYRPDYMHSYFFYDRSLMALVAAYLLDIPRGMTCYADHQLRDYELKVVPLHLELCDLVVATSERIRAELMAIAPEVDARKILVKPNGIDTKRFPLLSRSEPQNGGPFRLVSVSRIEPKKGLLDLVEAVRLLRDRGIDVEAHFIGDADEWSTESVEYKRRIDQRITDLGLWGAVHLEGRQHLSGVLRFHGLAHLFVAPYVETNSGDKDGIPTALLEGMATGLPSVATDAGSISEVIENGRTGLIVPQRQPRALADAIEMLLRDPSRRINLGNEAAATVRRRFDVASCEKVFHERVDMLLARSRGHV